MARATFPPVEDTARFDLLYTSNDGVAIVDCMNQLYAHRSVGWGVAEMEACAERIRAAWATNVAPIVQAEYALTHIRYKNLDNPLNMTGDFEFTDVPGTGTGDPIPFTSCAIVRFVTSGVTPSSCYIRHGGILESQVDGQHLGTAAVTSIATAWAAITTAINTVNEDHVCIQVFQPDPVGNLIYKDNGTFEDVQSNLVRRRLGRSVSRQK